MRVIIAEKNRGFRAEFVELITECHPAWQLEDTGDVAELRDMLSSTRVDLVFLDLNLPGLHTQLDLAALRARHPAAKIVGLGDTNDGATMIRCFEDGLGGYISRTCSGIKLLRTLRVIATPDLFISTGSCEPTEAAKLAPRRPLPSTLPPRRTQPELQLSNHPLTARQADVLNLLAEGRSTKDIARRLGLAVPTVKTHLAAVYRQLGARNRLQAVVKAGAMSSAVDAVVQGLGQGEMFERNFAAG